MKLTIEEALLILSAIKETKAKKAKLAYTLGVNRRRLEKETLPIDDARETKVEFFRQEAELAEKYGERVDDTTYALKKPVLFKKERDALRKKHKMDQFDKDMKELMQKEVEIDFHRISLSEIEDEEISADNMYHVMLFIDE